MSREIFLTDIHGYAKELKTLLDMILPLEQEDILTIGGDLFDNLDEYGEGVDPVGVYALIKALKDQYGEQVVLLKANHDDAFQYFHGVPSVRAYPRNFWLKYMGGRRTMNLFLLAEDSPYNGKEDTEAIARWIHENSVLFFETDNAFYAHAYYNPEVETPEEDMLWSRKLLYDYRGAKPLVIGHTTVMRADILCRVDIRSKEAPVFLLNNVILMDNGCRPGRSLVAFDIISYTAYYSDGRVKDIPKIQTPQEQ